MNKLFTKKRIIFLLLFGVLMFIANRINFSTIIGAEKQYFTLFQFFGPVAGSFLGPVFGAVSVLIASTADYIAFGKAFSLINIIRLTPMLFAAYYFGTKKKTLGVVLPIIAMFLFIAHPVGNLVWFYSLYWLIPIAVKAIPKLYNNLFLRSLGTTFTAHAVGSVAFLYTIPMTAGQWMGLIPIVAYERFMFAAGISVSYVVINTVLDKLSDKLKWKIPTKILYLDKRYSLG